MNGLHRCKPENVPTVGQVKTFQVIQHPAANGKQAWTQVKGATIEKGGAPYTVTALQPTGKTDDYGNVSFNITIEPAPGQQPAQQTYQTPPPRSQAGAQQGRAMSKDDYWARKEERDMESNRRQGRAHSQHMALLYFQIVGGFPEGVEIGKAIREKTDYFELDKDRRPKDPPPPESYSADNEGVY